MPTPVELARYRLPAAGSKETLSERASRQQLARREHTAVFSRELQSAQSLGLTPLEDFKTPRGGKWQMYFGNEVDVDNFQAKSTRATMGVARHSYGPHGKENLIAFFGYQPYSSDHFRDDIAKLSKYHIESSGPRNESLLEASISWGASGLVIGAIGLSSYNGISLDTVALGAGFGATVGAFGEAAVIGIDRLRFVNKVPNQGHYFGDYDAKAELDRLMFHIDTVTTQNELYESLQKEIPLEPDRFLTVLKGDKRLLAIVNQRAVELDATRHSNQNDQEPEQKTKELLRATFILALSGKEIDDQIANLSKQSFFVRVLN